MIEMIKKYWRFYLLGLATIVLVTLVYFGGTYVYRNSYESEEFEYANKQYLDQVLDKNVVITKKIKRNNKEGKIEMSFDKKGLEEVYQFTLGSEINPYAVEIGVIGKIESGSIHIAMKDDGNNVIFDRIVNGNTIKEISTPDAYSKNYKLYIVPSDAQNGNITLNFRFK